MYHFNTLEMYYLFNTEENVTVFIVEKIKFNSNCF